MRPLKNTITQKDLEDVAKMIFDEIPKDSLFVTYETPFGIISVPKYDPLSQHE